MITDDLKLRFAEIDFKLENGYLIATPIQGYKITLADYEIDWASQERKAFEQDGNSFKMLYNNQSDYDFNFEVEIVEVGKLFDTTLNSIYLVDFETAKGMINDRFLMPFGATDEQGNTQFEDFGENILGLIDLPFDIPNEFKQVEKTINLKRYETKYRGYKLIDDNLIINMGSISVPKGEDFTDYQYLNAILHLPYTASIDIPLDYLMGETISIEYNINLYNGECLVNLTTTKTNSIFRTVKTDLGVTVPFTQIQTMPSMNDARSIKLSGYNNIDTAFIELLKNKIEGVDKVFNTSVSDEKTLREVKGFVEVEQIELASRANQLEKMEILSLLRTGVFIK